MKALNKPTSVEHAISLSRQNRENGGWLWAQFLVYFLEDKRQGAALDFAFALYRKVEHRKKSDVFSNLLSRVLKFRDCHEATPAEVLSEVSKEIWYDHRDASLTRKGLTRILDAMVSRKQKFGKYLVELSRAIQMSVNDELYGISFGELEAEARRLDMQLSEEC